MRAKLLLVITAAVALMATGGILRSGEADRPASAQAAAARRASAVPPVPNQPTVRTSAPAAPAAPPSVSFPSVGRRSYLTAPGTGPVLGVDGPILRFRVRVERDIAGVDVEAFARFVEQTYADPRGWTAGGDRRFRRVGPGRRADFTLYLVTPATRDRLCGTPYDRYTSCRNGDKVVLNVARWVRGVPGYGAPLDTYRRYLVNHETGHRLGKGHELCPRRGRPAPVMQQQTLGLHGCRANPWPYVGGRSHRGPSGQYDDRLPPRSER